MRQLTALTDRYVRNLLSSGINHDFLVCSLIRRVIVEDQITVGMCYEINIRRGLELELITALGTTPKHACRRALEKAGVTFR